MNKMEERLNKKEIKDKVFESMPATFSFSEWRDKLNAHGVYAGYHYQMLTSFVRNKKLRPKGSRTMIYMKIL